MSSPADPPLDELLARMKWVRSLATAMVKDADQADDLAQDAWRQALEKPAKPGSAWRGWFTLVMRNRMRDQWHASELRQPLDAQLPAPAEPATPEETVHRLETQQALGDAVQGLAEPYRSTILLHYFEGWSHRQIAAAEGVQVRAIESRLRRGRELIRKNLEKRGPAEHWAAGLLLLARRTPPPLPILRSMVAAGLTIAAGFVTWMALADGDSSSPTPAALSARADPSGPSAAASAALEDLPASGVLREDFEPAARILRLAVVDAHSGRPLAGVRVHGEFLDGKGQGLDALTWLSTVQASQAIAIPEGAQQIRLVAEATASHAGQPAGALYSWEAQGAEPLIQIASERLRGEILGQVLDLAGHPVPGAEVGLWLGRQESRGIPPDRRILAAADGSFAVPLALAQEAEIFLAPRAPGHSAQRCYRLDRQRPANAFVDKLELLLAPGRELSLTVLDESGAPIPDAEVVVWPSHRAEIIPVFPLGHYEGQLQHLLRTDRHGRAPALVIGQEPHTLAVRHPNHSEVSLELGDLSAPLTLTLAPAVQLRGRVLTPDGEPAAEVRVIAEGSSSVECPTDDDGFFQLASPSRREDEIRLILVPRAPFALQVVGPLRPADLESELEFRLDVGHGLLVRLVGEDGELCNEVPGLRAELSGGPMTRALQGDGRNLQSWTEFLPPRQDSPFRTVQPAVFSAEGLPEADYLVSFWGRDGLVAQAKVRADGKPTDLRLGQYPEPRASLGGRLVHAASGAPVTQFQLECQRLASPDPADRLPDQISMSYRSVDGSFLCEGIPPGWWQVRIFGPEPGFSWGLEAVQLSPGQPLILDSFLDDVVEGRLLVLDAAGKPMPNVKVRLLDPQGQACAFGDPTRFHDQTDAAGSLFLQRLPRSRALQVELSDASGRIWTMPAGTLDLSQNSWTLQAPS